MKLKMAMGIGLFGSVLAACGGSSSTNPSNTGGTSINGGTGATGGTGGSGTGDSGGVCKAVAACGGAIDGTWEVTSTCVHGDLTAVMLASMASGGNAPPAACNSLFQNFTIEMSGTVTAANGTETDNLTMTMKGKAHYTPACVSALSGTAISALSASMCSAAESNLKSNTTFNSATCSLNAGNCDCDLTAVTKETDTSQYTTSGNQLIDPTGKNDPFDYCVSGTTLTLSQDSTDLPGTLLVTTFHRK